MSFSIFHIHRLDLILALAGSAATFWSIGRHYGKRRFKVAALLGWLIVINDATTYGDGGELLVQGDRAGMTFLASALDDRRSFNLFYPLRD